MYSDREILYFLQSIPGIGNRTIQKLWNSFANCNQIYTAKEDELRKILSTAQIKVFFQEREKETPSEKIAKLEKSGIQYYSIFDWQYPKRLRPLSDAPLALFVKGKLPSETEMTAAVVGARYHSVYGRRQAKAFSALLAEKGIGVVSGMAKGIDSIAQLSAIENGGNTYAVLGCGVDVCYPKESQKLYDKIPEHGGIISEYLPGTMPKAGLFPPRNRIISGLGDILLVIEAREKSGTLITVDTALEQGKEIWALPGRTEDILSMGCNRLIFQGAGILTDVFEFSKELDALHEMHAGRNGKRIKGTENVGKAEKEVLEEKVEKIKQEKKSKPGNESINFNDAMESAILSLLSYEALSLEAVYERLQKEYAQLMDQKTGQSIAIAELSVWLLNLCMENKIRQIQGGYFVRQDKGI